MLGVWAVSLALVSTSQPALLPMKDFVEYWSAARVHVRGGNPYDGAQLLPLQREAYHEPDKTQPVMLWTPPWTLPLYLPFGWVEPVPGHLAWLVIQLGCVLVSSWMVWKVYGGQTIWWPVPAFVFAPTWMLMLFGQNTAFVLVGLAGFLYCRTRGYPVLAGVIGALTAIKPHLLALFGLALLLDLGSREGRRVILGGCITLVVGSVLACLPNPQIFSQYLEAMTRPHTEESPSVTRWNLPLFSFYFRMWIDPHRFSWQFLPIALGCLALLPYWWSRRTQWDWKTEVPRLAFASFLLAPYGGWLFDLVVLLVPVTAAVAQVSARMDWMRLGLAGLVVMFPFAMLIRDLSETYWLTPALIVWYVGVLALPRFAVRTIPGLRS